MSYLAVDAKPARSCGGKTDTLTLNLRPETQTRVAQDAVSRC